MKSKLLAALLVSEAVHLMLFGILAEMTIGPPREFVVNITAIDEYPDLVSDEIGNDPDLPLFFYRPWIDDVDIPGPVVPEEAIQ